MNTTFLIADDSPQKIQMLQHFLQQARWEGAILVAETTEDAMQLIDEYPDIGFAFVDYYMPSENGPAVIHHLKTMNPLARIALVSSSDSKSNADEAKAAGAETTLCTTYQADMVEKAMRELLEEWKSSLMD